jgi:hypothetical protein
MSKRRRIEPRVLLVEGKDEQRLLPELLELGGIEWPDRSPPIWIEEKDGVEKVLEDGSIEAEFQASGLQSLGIVVDANGDPEARWTRIRKLLVPFSRTSLSSISLLESCIKERMAGASAYGSCRTTSAPECWRPCCLRFAVGRRPSPVTLGPLVMRPSDWAHRSGSLTATRPSYIPGLPGKTLRGSRCISR